MFKQSGTIVKKYTTSYSVYHKNNNIINIVEGMPRDKLYEGILCMCTIIN